MPHHSSFRSRKALLFAALSCAASLALACGSGSTSGAAHGAAGASTSGASGANEGGASAGDTSLGGASAGGTTAMGGESSGVAGLATAGTAGVAATSLAAKYADYFPIGVAISAWHLDHLSPVIAADFNHLTCENAMKVQDIHPAEATFNWTEADRIADFARSHGMKMTGHNLLWHRQAPAWMFAGVTAGNAASLETLKSRLKSHIEAVIFRYADVVDNWDVVNEAISDTTGKVYRDGGEMSKWYELFGSEEYLYWAYKYAHDALEAKAAGSSKGKLYYNEYVVTVKADKILTMFAWLETKGIHVDGVGFQSHENMTWPAPADLQSAFDKFVKAGYKLKVSELDVTVYSDYSTGSFVAAPQVAYTPELAAAQAARFAQLFALYRKNKANITSVTFWGVSDDNTWLDNEPVAGRKDYPLLYDVTHAPKSARAAIMAF